MAIGRETYRDGKKKNWRGWAYNRIVERLSIPPEKAIVLYLGGKENNDEEKLLRCGFRKENLFICETDRDAVRVLRKKKCNVLGENMRHVVQAWDKEPMIDVVMADLVGGFTKDADLILSSFWRLDGFPPGSILAINMQRGRDLQTCKGAQEFLRIPPSLDEKFDEIYTIMKEPLPEKHRGRWIYAKSLIIAFWHEASIRLALEDGFRESELAPYSHAFWNYMEPRMRFCFNMYQRAGRLFFDSVVLKKPVEYVGLPTSVMPNPHLKKVKAKIAAAKAIRTMRMASA